MRQIFIEERTVFSIKRRQRQRQRQKHHQRWKSRNIVRKNVTTQVDTIHLQFYARHNNSHVQHSFQFSAHIWRWTLSGLIAISVGFHHILSRMTLNYTNLAFISLDHQHPFWRLWLDYRSTLTYKFWIQYFGYLKSPNATWNPHKQTTKWNWREKKKR